MSKHSWQISTGGTTHNSFSIIVTGSVEVDLTRYTTNHIL